MKNTSKIFVITLFFPSAPGFGFMQVGCVAEREVVLGLDFSQ